MLVQKKACSSSNIARPEVLDLEIDEIIQRVRIKFWRALLTKHIDHHRAYIRSIVSNEFNDLGRRRKAPLTLPTDEDGELYMGNVLVNESNELKDQVDNLIRLTEAFEKREVNIKTMKWPEDPADSKRLKASLSPARHLIARRVGLNLSEYKKWGAPEALILSYIHDEIKEC